MELVMSSEFARKNKSRKKKLDRLIYVRNVNINFNHERPIKHMVEVELFYRGNKDRYDKWTEIKCYIRNTVVSMPQSRD